MPSSPLSGSWEIGAVAAAPFSAVDDLADVAEWLPAEVPGAVNLALAAVGRIPDPLSAGGLAAGRWTEGLDWWYRRSFRAAPAPRSFVILRGVDYLSAVYLNGHLLGLHEGMFSPQIYEVTSLLQDDNLLAVRLWGPAAFRRFPLRYRDRLRRWVGKRLFGGDLFPDRLATLKCQMSFGWDFAPRLPAIGIWDDVFLHPCGTARLAGAFPRARFQGTVVYLDLRVELDAAARLETVLDLALEGLSGPAPRQRTSFPLVAPRGRSVHEVSLPVEQPQLWEPWERGQPNLYRLRLSLREGADLLDGLALRTGLRHTSLQSAPRARSKDPLSLVVNGQPVFIRGANWVPADALYARLQPRDYEELVGLAKAANVNLLRVWGGGLREKAAFYDACDAAGIMVWQEFPFACAFLDHLPRDPAYLDVVRQETREIVLAVRHHPSIVAWCGGNEFNPRRERSVVKIIAEAVVREDASRPFRPASPAGGDHHNWRVWHGKANLRDYLKDDAILASEFGLQSVPRLDTLHHFLRPEDLLAPGPAWEDRGAQLAKLRRYAAAYAPATVEEFVAATQRAQAQGLQVAVEHFRRRKGYTTGVLFWQFNEPWGAISWSILDYYRNPKLAYHKVKQVYSPVLVSVAYPLRRYQPGETLQGTVYAINDLREELTDCELTVAAGGGIRFHRTITLPPDSCQALGEVSFVLEDLRPLCASLQRGGVLLSENEYDLSYADSLQISRVDALRDWLTWRMLG